MGLSKKPDSITNLEICGKGHIFLHQGLVSMLKSIRSTWSRHSSSMHAKSFSRVSMDSLLPKGKLNKMKTFKDKNPLNANLDKTVIDKFINQQIPFGLSQPQSSNS